MITYFKNKYKYLKFKKYIKNIDIQNIKRFSFEGVEKYAYIISCYDGDTCTILFKWKKQNIKISCRIYGIDTPEIRTTNKEEKKKAIESRDYLRSLILNKIVFVKIMKYDKYGRPLIQLYYNNIDISKEMIEKGYGKEYFGGSRK